MQLYHFSKICLDRLIPQEGNRRHNSEDARAAGRPVVWLTDNPNRAPGVEGAAKFRHTVEVEESDPLLTKDESVEKLKSLWDAEIGGPLSTAECETIYFYDGELNVIGVHPIT